MVDRTVEFRPDGPFRQFVVAFWIGYHGMFDLFTRGAQDGFEKLRRTLGGTRSQQQLALSNMVRDGRITEPMRKHLDAIFAFDAPLHPWPLELRKRGGNSIGVQPTELAREIQEQAGAGLPTTHMAVLCGGLLVSAYQATRNYWPTPTTPEYQFLRHCRNAAAHGFQFNLHKDEPRHPASWRGLAIDRSWIGEPLIRSDVFGASGKMEPGDPILLLWDLEQTLPVGWTRT